ncbi:response regulator transcription factor [Anaerovibrio sp.]|uniref:response regulator transcription factor n=1 Tax=Anaerovibrio sp. TaxID=1872532 RepID=UPI003F16A8AE
MLKIAIVEDEEIIRMGLACTVDWQSMDARVVGEAADGVEGLEIAAAVHPDVVLTDIKMPRMNGLDMAKVLAERYPWMKVVFLTSYADFEYARQAVRLNACDYLLKPVDEEELASLLARLNQDKALHGADRRDSPADGSGGENADGAAETAGDGSTGADGLVDWQELLMHEGLNVYVRQTLEKIQAEYASRLSIEDCAEAMQVSTSYLSRKLKEATGHTFGTLLARYRLQEALKLLEDGRYKVYEVAEHTGFGEYKNFCQVFKKYLYVSPKRYMQERELKIVK